MGIKPVPQQEAISVEDMLHEFYDIVTEYEGDNEVLAAMIVIGDSRYKRFKGLRKVLKSLLADNKQPEEGEV